VSGQSYESYLRQHIFAPAGMRTAIFRDEVPSTDSLFAHGYVGTPRGLEPGPPNPYVWGTRGAGGVWTTVGDMYRWIVAVEDGAVLPAEQRALLFLEPKPPSEEAFGWHVRPKTTGSRARIDKGGGSDDFASQLLHYPAERATIIWASNNLRQRWRQALNQALPDIVFGGPGLPLPRPARLVTADLSALARRYAAGADSVVLRAGDGYLYADTNTAKVPTDVMFFPEDRSTFIGFNPATRTVTRLRFTFGVKRSPILILPDDRRLTVRP